MPVVVLLVAIGGRRVRAGVGKEKQDDFNVIAITNNHFYGVLGQGFCLSPRLD